MSRRQPVPRSRRSPRSRVVGSRSATRSPNSTAPSRSSSIAAPLLARHGVGKETAGALLVTAGDNPDRIHNEKSYAALCGSSPVEISSGRTNRHRLNRAGDRQANSALWVIAMVRIRSRHAPTIAYIQRRTAEGLSKRDIIRCLKRYIAREVFTDIQRIMQTHNTHDTNVIAA